MDTETVLVFVGLAALLAILTMTAFVALVVGRAVERRPEVAAIDPKMLDIVIKVSSFTFAVSGTLMLIMYMFGGLFLIFGLPIILIDTFF